MLVVGPLRLPLQRTEPTGTAREEVSNELMPTEVPMNLILKIEIGSLQAEPILKEIQLVMLKELDLKVMEPTSLLQVNSS